MKQSKPKAQMYLVVVLPLGQAPEKRKAKANTSNGRSDGVTGVGGCNPVDPHHQDRAARAQNPVAGNSPGRLVRPLTGQKRSSKQLLARLAAEIREKQ